MFFGDNNIRLQFGETFDFNMNTLDALMMVSSIAPDFKVRDSENWSLSNEGLVKQLEEENELTKKINYDWTYTTEYKGTLIGNNGIEETNDKINIELLKRDTVPLYYQELILFEDELADNGIAQCKIRVRVMQSCFLVLMRFFLRVDGVLFRIYDTRIFHEFGDFNYVIREFRKKEGEYLVIDELIKNNEHFGVLSNEDIASEITPTISTKLEKIYL